MSNEALRNYIRANNAPVSNNSEILQNIFRYEGRPDPNEDAADYMAVPPEKAVRLA